MRLRVWLGSCFLIYCLFTVPTWADETHEYLGARVAALGGAGSALAGPPEGMFLNPATLVYLRNPEISCGGGSYSQTNKRDLFLAGAIPLVGDLIFGVGGGKTYYSSFTLAGYQFALFSLAFPLSPNGKLLLGFNGKFLQYQLNDLANVNSGGGVDLGFYYTVWDTHPGFNWSLGLSCIDAQSVIKDPMGEIRLPSIFRIGSTFSFSTTRLLLLEYDSQQTYNQSFENTQSVRGGLEQAFFLADNTFLFARFGYTRQWDQNGWLTAGWGVEYQDWRLDYALQIITTYTQNAHRLSVSWGKRRSVPTPQSPAQSPEHQQGATRLFSVLEIAAKQEGKNPLSKYEERRATPTPEPQKATPEPTPTEEDSYHLPLPSSPADRENVSLGVNPELPAMFSRNFAQPARDSIRIVNQALRLHVVVNPFSPNGDGKQDKTMFVATMSSDKRRIDHWLLDIVSNSRMVASFKGGSILPRNLEWEGKDLSGKPLPDGNYNAVLRVMDLDGMEIASDMQAVKIQTKSEPVKMKGPEKEVLTGDANDQPLEFTLPLIRGSGDWQFTILSSSGKKIFEKTGGDQVPRIFRWPPRIQSRPVPAGEYRAVLNYRDEIGLKTKTEHLFNIKYAQWNLVLNAAPALFQPTSKGGKGVAFQTEIQGTGPKAKSWILQIVQKDRSEPVMVYKGTGSPPETITWDGNSSKGENAVAGSIYNGLLTITTVVNTETQAESPRVQCDLGSYTGEKALAINLVRVTFAPALAELTDEMRKALLVAVETLKKYQTDYLLQITGHCDPQEVSAEKTIELSRLRAQQVTAFLIQQGVPENRIQEVGKGSNQPLSQDTTEEAKAKNRRVEILLFAK